jgi:hypothetical protein
MNPSISISAVVAINNGVSAELARDDLSARGIALDSVALILLRDIDEPWMRGCAVVLRYPGRPSNKVSGQWRFVAFYQAASRLLRSLERSGRLSDIYIVNNDNLISSHLLSLARNFRAISVTVVAEGLMNFQEITIGNRAGWRWLIKPVIARLFGFAYRQPTGHLSGAFDPLVTRVISFAKEGLKAPPNKVVLRRYRPVPIVGPSDPNIALIVLTGLNQWMDPARFEPFARAFVAWIEGSGYERILVKKHPRVYGGLIQELLAGYEEVGQGLTCEAMAPNMRAGTVIGTCCTALVTLKLARPDLRCIDFGSDYYCENAYRGDHSVKSLLLATNIELVQMPAAHVEHSGPAYPDA